MKSTPLTAKGAQMLRDELRRLVTVERPRAIHALAEARGNGEPEENAEYTNARDGQAFVEGRIAEIEAKLASAQVIDTSAVNFEGRVVFGATVRLSNHETGEEVTYQIVGEDEADVKAGKVSVASPLARALIGRATGDIAVADTPTGGRSYTILEVHYE